MDVDMDRVQQVMAGVIAVLVIAVLLLWFAVQELDAETATLQDNVSGLETAVTDLRTARACDVAAEQLNEQYCNQYVANPETVDDGEDRCQLFQAEPDAFHEATATEVGCTISAEIDAVDGLVTADGRVPVEVQGETVDCVEAGYITLDCPA